MSKHHLKCKSEIIAHVLMLFITIYCVISTNLTIASPTPSKMNNHIIISAGDKVIKKLIALNDSACALLIDGEIYCWDNKTTGRVDLEKASHVDLTDNALAEEIYGISVDMDEFDTGYHACATLKNNDIRCWGKNIEDIFDFYTIFEQPTRPDKTTSDLMSFKIKHQIAKKMNYPKKIITNAGVVCSITRENKLFCPHEHLAFLNGEKNIESAVFGEILACLHKTSKEVECYDMRAEENKKPVTLSFNGELFPKQFASRIIYSWGTCIIDSKSQLACWDGEHIDDINFSYIYNIETKKMTMQDKSAYIDIQLTDTHSCVLQANNSVYCWGSNESGQLGSTTESVVKNTTYSSFPGNKMKFNTKGKVKSIAIGHGFSCFHIGNSIECFGKI